MPGPSAAAAGSTRTNPSTVTAKNTAAITHRRSGVRSNTDASGSVTQRRAASSIVRSIIAAVSGDSWAERLSLISTAAINRVPSSGKRRSSTSANARARNRAKYRSTIQTSTPTANNAIAAIAMPSRIHNGNSRAVSRK